MTKISNLQWVVTLLTLILVNSAIAETTGTTGTTETDEPEYNIIDIAGYEVPVIAGGLYDRFRSNPPLSVIAEEAPEIDLSWFETIEKTKVDVGFETYSPNFFYSNTKITAIFTADMRRLRDLMPAELMHIVQPLEIFPGRGMVAITAYAYHYCDNDFYNEFSVSIVTNRAGRPNHGFISLLAQMDNNDYWGYVLKLPVDTELARVRGVVGYNLPKWLTKMSYSSDEQSVSFQIFDEITGELDLTFEGKVLETSSNVEVVRNNFTNVDQAGNLTRGYTDSRNLAYATSMKGSDVNLTLREGSLSDFIHSLELGIMIQYEYVPEFQSALYSTEPLED